MKKFNIKEKLLNIYTLKNYALILPYAKPYWFRALLAVAITMPVGSMDAVIAWSLKPFMDVVLVEKQTGWTMYIPLLIIVFSVLQALFTYISTYMNTWVGNKMANDLKRDLFHKLMRSDAAFFDKSNSGEVLFNYNNCAEYACSGLLNSMKMFSTRLFSSLSLICVLFYNSWQLAIVAVIVMFGALYPLTKARKRLKKVFTLDMNVMAELLNCYNETFGGNKIISAYNLRDYCKARFVKVVNTIFELSLRMVKRMGIIAPAMHVISSLGIAFVIWYGSYLIVNHQITVGNFASFITSLVMLYNPLKSIGNNYNGVIMSLMMVENVMNILHEEPKIKSKENAENLPDCNGDICYKNVCFEYEKDHPVLKNINLDITAGQTIALVGNSGGGKTTISTLLPRFYDVKSGEILIDGHNVKDLDLDCLRRNIAIVFQDNFLFGNTIRENILLGQKDVSEEQLALAVKSACLEEFIASLPDGLDTVIGERGVTLSGGQKQRIAIARAFIKNAPILILDEATSALDNKSEAVVQQAIDNLMKNRTVLVIAHRLSTVRNADCIVVLNNGEIVEKGKHEELLALGGEYAALYRTQLS
jgi:subfamily B ATP-binding cassette protein MsbA